MQKGKKMKNNTLLMLDCETLSFDSKAVVLQLCFVQFDLDNLEVANTYNFYPNVQYQKEVLGRIEDPLTVEWWKKTNEPLLKDLLTRGHNEEHTSSGRLASEILILLEDCDFVYSKGTMDLNWITSFLEHWHLKAPYRKFLCTRTWHEILGHPKLLEFEDYNLTAHEAESDCKMQIYRMFDVKKRNSSK